MLSPEEIDMFKKILIGLAALILIFVAIVAMQPADFRVERTAKIAAPQADVFAQGERLPQMGRLVALGQARPCRQSRLRRA